MIMSRLLVLLSAALLEVAGTAAAQEIPEFNKLRTPTSPAFVVLGTTPAEVQRPNTPSSFAFSLLQGVSSGLAAGGDFAVEVAPYWLVSHPGLTLDEYYAGGWANNLARTATLSFATVTAEDAAAPSGKSRNLGLGFRARLLDVTSPSADCAVQMDSIGVDLMNLATAINVPIAQEFQGADVNDPATAARIEERKEVLFHQFLQQSLNARQKQRLSADVQACAHELSAREGFQMDFAGAAAWHLPNQEPGLANLSGGAVWLTPSFTGRNFSWVGVGRYRWNQDTDGENLIDAGLRGIYAWSDYGLSMELVARHPTENGEDTYRVSLISDIMLSKDLWLTTSFGRDFTHEDSNSLFAIANLQWNIGKRSLTPDLPDGL
jgi:hypothetical protein